MKPLRILHALVLSSILFNLWGPTMQAANAENFFELNAKTIDEKEISLAEYKGKVILAVNVASKCGFTKQYEGLEAIYKKYQDKGFVVLGFPSNDFGGQEPGSAEEIKAFCTKNYGVTFPILSKAPVLGGDKQPVFSFLTKATGGAEVGWNFEKFLVDQKGEVRGRFKSNVTPEAPELVKQIEALLAE